MFVCAGETSRFAHFFHRVRREGEHFLIGCLSFDRLRVCGSRGEGNSCMIDSQSFGTFTIDRTTREVSISGVAMNLTCAEYNLLDILTEFPRKAFFADDVIRAMNGSDWVGNGHALQSCVSRLRKKLKEASAVDGLIANIHGYGYRFEPGGTAQPTPEMAAATNAIPKSAETDVAHIAVNLDRRITWAAPNIENLLGWTPTDLIGTILYELLHPDDQPLALQARGTIDTGQPVSLHLRYLTASGDYRKVIAAVKPLVDENGNTISFIGELRPAPATTEQSPQPL
jgi:PAS domain S-box-containing protein